MSGVFDPARCAVPAGMSLVCVDETGSTNDDVRKHGRAGAPQGLVVVAERQSAGRGRRGAAWVCPPGEGLAFSLLVRPQEPKPMWPRLALAAGLAVAEALDFHGVEAGVKWPNDVWIGSRKLCGILVEADPEFAVVGVGLNVNVGEFPAELEDIATSLRRETGIAYRREEVLARVLARMAVRLPQIGGGFGGLLEALSERCVLRGRRISLLASGEYREGVMEGFAPGGGLLLRSGGELAELIQADEVRLLP